jgi:hypothetical protein
MWWDHAPRRMSRRDHNESFQVWGDDPLKGVRDAVRDVVAAGRVLTNQIRKPLEFPLGLLRGMLNPICFRCPLKLGQPQCDCIGHAIGEVSWQIESVPGKERRIEVGQFTFDLLPRIQRAADGLEQHPIGAITLPRERRPIPGVSPRHERSLPTEGYNDRQACPIGAAFSATLLN